MCIAYIRKHSFPNINTKQRSICNNPCDDEFDRTITQSVRSSEKNRVKFSEDPPEVMCTVTPSSAQTFEEKASVHWQPEDYERFKSTARIIATEVLKLSLTQPSKSHSYDAILTKVLQICTSSSGTGLNEDSSAKNESLDSLPLPQELFASLAHWIRAGSSRRGLEKFSVPRKFYLAHSLMFPKRRCNFFLISFILSYLFDFIYRSHSIQISGPTRKCEGRINDSRPFKGSETVK